MPFFSLSFSSSFRFIFISLLNVIFLSIGREPNFVGESSLIKVQKLKCTNLVCTNFLV